MFVFKTPRLPRLPRLQMATLQRSILKSFHGALLFATAHACAGPVQSIRIGPIDASRAGVTMVLSANAVKKCAGQYRGQVLFFEATPAVNVSGTLKSVAGACEMTTSIPWSGLSEQVFRQARGDVLQVRFRGELIAGKAVTKVNWALSAPKADVLLTEPMSDTVKRFAKATDLHVGSINLKASTVNADINVQSPLAFELRVLQATCELRIHGTVVATGVKESFILASGRPTSLRIPVTINHKALLSAAGNVFAQRGKIDGKLSGLVRVRLPGGDADFPMEFPVLLKLM